MLAWAHFQPVCKQKLQRCKLSDLHMNIPGWDLTLETVSRVFKLSCTGGFSSVVSQNTSTDLRGVLALGTSPAFGLLKESLEVKRLMRSLFLWALCQTSVNPRESLSSLLMGSDLGFALLTLAHTAQSPGLPAGVAQQLPVIEWGPKAACVA